MTDTTSPDPDSNSETTATGPDASTVRESGTGTTPRVDPAPPTPPVDPRATPVEPPMPPVDPSPPPVEPGPPRPPVEPPIPSVGAATTATAPDAAPNESSPPEAPAVDAPAVGASTGAGDTTAPRDTSTPWKAISAVLVVLLLGIVGYLVFANDDGDDTASPTPTTAAAAAGEFVTVRDAAAGFTIEYPENWKTIRPADGEERLLLSAGGQSYFQLKVRNIDPATVNQEIQTAMEGLKMITEPRQVTLNGIPASLYLYYTPVTEQSPEEGVHVHYFILKSERLYSMVFQALPADTLNDLVPVFDRVAKSFRFSDVTVPEGTSSSAPPTTAPPR